MRLMARVLVVLVFVPLVAWGRGRDKATCPVDKKTFEVGDKTPHVSVNDKASYFCNDNCLKAFAKEPEKFIDAKSVGNCPMMKKKTAKVEKNRRLVINNDLWYVCCNDCMRDVPKAPANIVGNLTDPVTKNSFKPTGDSPRSDSGGQIYLFEDKDGKAKFDKEPAKYVIKFGS